MPAAICAAIGKVAEYDTMMNLFHRDSAASNGILNENSSDVNHTDIVIFVMRFVGHMG